MRHLITLLLCLALPWQAWAAQSAVVVLCPMGGMDMVAVMGADTSADTSTDTTPEAEADGSCCNDLAAFLQTGQHCKSGPDCTTANVLFPAEERAVAVLPYTGILRISLTPPPPLSQTAGIWRPPTRAL